MKNGELSDFIDGLNYGYEMLFLFDGIKYFIQGWTKDNKCYMVLDIPEKTQSEYVWKYEAPTMRECADAFLSEKLWTNKNFYEIEKDVTWVDW